VLLLPLEQLDFAWPPLVYLFENLLRPPNRVRDRAHRGGNSLPRIVLRELSCRKDRSSDQQHALATFVHGVECNMFVFCSPSLGEATAIAWNYAMSVEGTRSRILAHLSSNGSTAEIASIV
jgi:hypothetical protein